MILHQLSPDFQRPLPDPINILPGEDRESPVFFKHKDHYFLMTSGQPSPAMCDACHIWRVTYCGVHSCQTFEIATAGPTQACSPPPPPQHIHTVARALLISFGAAGLEARQYYQDPAAVP